MEEITIKPLCLIIRFKNLTYKLWSLTEEGLLEQKQELINKLEKEFQFVEYVVTIYELDQKITEFFKDVNKRSVKWVSFYFM